MGDLVDFLVQNEPSFRKARLPALYSDFRGQQAINPDAYQANVSAWRRALASIACAGLAPSSSRGGSAAAPSSLVLDVDEGLLRALESKQYGRPLALGTVVREAVAQRDLYPLPDFLRARESIFYRSWSSLPWDVFSWGLRQLGLASASAASSAGGEDRLPRGRFVVLAGVEAAAKAFGDEISAFSSRLDRTWSKAHFHRTFAGAILDDRQLSETDMEVLLKFLSRDRGLILFDGQTVKIKSPGAGDEEAAAITPDDESIASLKELIEYLGHQTDILGRRVEELGVAAKEAVARKNRVAALAALKSKKRAEASLETRFATLGQLEEAAAKIEQASDSVQLVRVMSASADVLRGLNAQAGGADRVGDAVERLREQMGQADEVGSILAESAGPPVDEGEIDDQLAVLEGEMKSGEEEESTRAEAEREREAGETRRRLAELDALKPAAEAEKQAGSEREVNEAEKELGRMSLEEPRPET